MRVAALYDIHGNLPALEAVLDEIGRAGADQVVVGGDVVPGPMPRECLARLADLGVPTRFIYGNGERAVLAEVDGTEAGGAPAPYRHIMRWTAGQLDAEQQRTLAGWPMAVRVTVDGLGDVLFCHATPRNDTEIFTEATAEERLRPVFEGVREPLVICGHTHMPFDRMVGRTRVINAGSVGMPFGATGADWLLLGPGVEMRHTDYDLMGAAGRIRGTAYPDAQEFVAQYLLQPPSRAQMLEAFAKGELR